jgi:mannosyltransferase OCH1-like enzyme
MSSLKVISQIYISDNNQIPNLISQNIEKTKQVYSDYIHNVYDHEMCRQTVKDTLGTKGLLLFDKIKPFAFKADLARYVILYNKGGYYYDVGFTPLFKFESYDDGFIYPTHHTVNNCFINGFMSFNIMQHNFLKEAIDKSLQNIENNYYGSNALDITGPTMLYRCNHSGMTKGDPVLYNDKYQLEARYNNQIHFLSKPLSHSGSLTQLGAIGTNNYGDMFINKVVY